MNELDGQSDRFEAAAFPRERDIVVDGAPLARFAGALRARLSEAAVLEE
jgi:hypothetical protein